VPEFAAFAAAAFAQLDKAAVRLELASFAAVLARA